MSAQFRPRFLYPNFGHGAALRQLTLCAITGLIRFNKDEPYSITLDAISELLISVGDRRGNSVPIDVHIIVECQPMKSQILLDDPSGNPIELFQPAR